ncbi:MAG TPA: hypothetical protein DCE78_13115 [Bacteroidetes bacterium]|nr:hypothetical protein [Bacteroidota bacterium]
MMRLRSRVPFQVLLTVFLLTGSIAYGQQGQSNADRPQSRDAINQYVDEIGLGMITNGFMMEAAIDPDSYLLGPMDAITITIRGAVPVIMRGIVVNPLGEVVLPTIGNVSVRDLTITEAREKIESVITRYYKFDQVTITLDVPRPVAVHLTGESPRPGLQYVPATTRVDKVVLGNILTTISRPVPGTDDEGVNAAPMVTTIEPAIPINLSSLEREFELGDSRLQHYSLRNLLIKHRDGSSTSADIIGYFYTGDLDLNPVIQSGDRIVLESRNQSSPRVSVSGMVKRPFESEFRAGDTIAQLLKMAGGVNDYGSTESVRVLSSGNVEIVSANEFESYEVEPDSRLIVNRTSAIRQNHSAWVSGEVLNPGIYPIIDGKTTVQDLIEMAGGLTEYSLANAAFIDREGLWKNLMTEQPDYDWTIGLINRTSDVYTESVNTLYLERAGSLSLIPIDLNNTAKTQEIKLSDNDRLIIPKDRNSVAVIGQANSTGYYPFKSGLSADDYIRMAGGTTGSADVGRIFVIKAGSMTWFKHNETTIESGDMVYVDRVPRETFTTLRQYELAKTQQRNSTIQIVISGISAIAGILTTILILNER